MRKIVGNKPEWLSTRFVIPTKVIAVIGEAGHVIALIWMIILSIGSPLFIIPLAFILYSLYSYPIKGVLTSKPIKYDNDGLYLQNEEKTEIKYQEIDRIETITMYLYKIKLKKGLMINFFLRWDELVFVIPFSGEIERITELKSLIDRSNRKNESERIVTSAAR